MGRPRRCLNFVEDCFNERRASCQARRPAEFQIQVGVRPRPHTARTTFNSRARGRGGKMKLRSIVWLLAPVFFVFLTFPACAQTPKNSTSTQSSRDNNPYAASISGTVFDPDGKPVAGARITLLYAMAGLEVTQTNAQGQYRFEDLRPGTYQMVGTASGFNEVTGDIELQADQKLIKDLKLNLSAVQERVVVSAAPGGALSSKIASSVSVVSAQEIDDRGAEAALDVLRGLPGVEINQSGGRGKVTSAFIRGGDSDYNLVLINGIQLNDFGGGFDLSPLPAEGVEQVEVIRGPESALYGSNAVAGVINIETIRGDGPPHFSFIGEAGSLYTWRIGTTGAGRTEGGFSWAYSMSRLQTRGQIQNDGYRDQPSTVSLGYLRSPRRKFNVNFFGNASAVGLPGPWGSDPDGLFPGRDNATHQNQNLFGYQAQYTEQFSSRFQQVTTVSGSTDRITFDSPSEGNSFTNNLRVVANTRSEIAVSSKDTLVAGFEYDRDSF